MSNDPIGIDLNLATLCAGIDLGNDSTPLAEDFKDLAELAYQLSDAMLVARSRS